MAASYRIKMNKATTYYNKEMNKAGDHFPYCYFCDHPHPMDNYNRQRVILSTSTLNLIQFMEGWECGTRWTHHSTLTWRQLPVPPSLPLSLIHI